MERSRSALFSSLRRYAQSRTLAIAGVLIATALVGVPPLEAAAATPYGVNLVKNAGAESGLGQWETFPSGDFRTQTYGPSGLGFPSQSTASSMGGGAQFFYAGPYDDAYGTCGDASQAWTLKGIGPAIDSGHVKVTLKGYAGTNGAADLNAHLDLYFRNSENHSVSSNGITKTASSTNEQYQRISASTTLSKHTRILRVHLWADGDATVSSGDCQAFWDNISVVLKRV
jgi:hypothetical protein